MRFFEDFLAVWGKPVLTNKKKRETRETSSLGGRLHETNAREGGNRAEARPERIACKGGRADRSFLWVEPQGWMDSGHPGKKNFWEISFRIQETVVCRQGQKQGAHRRISPERMFFLPGEVRNARPLQRLSEDRLRRQGVRCLHIRMRRLRGNFRRRAGCSRSIFGGTASGAGADPAGAVRAKSHAAEGQKKSPAAAITEITEREGTKI